MRKSLVIAVGCAFLLFAVVAIAQTDSSGQYGSQSNTSKTETQSSTSQSSTTTQMGASSGAQTIEGCLIKEQSDYFLVPRSGNPIKLQAGADENLSEHAGHKVKVTGTESPLNSGAMGSSGMGSSAGTTGAATGTPSSGNQGQTSSSEAMSSPTGSTSSSSTGSGMASGTGNDLHRMADEQLTVVKLQHEAASCPANWNPNVPTSSSSSGMGPHY